MVRFVLIYPVGHIWAPLIKQHFISAVEPRGGRAFQSLFHSKKNDKNNKNEKPSALYGDVLRMCTVRSDEEKK